MTAIRREIEIDASPTAVRETWDHFLTWVRTAQHRLACDELACTDAVGSGAVRFEGTSDGRTSVVVEIEPDGGPSESVLSQQIIHDLLVFKDYLERDRGGGKASGREDRARLHDDERSNGPAHLRLSEENQNAPAGGSYTDRYPT